jgi:ribonuclease Y
MFLANIFVEGALFLAAGAGVAFVVMFLLQQKRERALVAQRQAALDSAKREAENVLREARIAANETALKIREETEASFSARRRELDDRETAIGRQLNDLLSNQNQLRQQQEQLDQQGVQAGARQKELDQLTVQRREQLEAASHLSADEARAALLQEVEQHAARDAHEISRRIVEDARTKAEDSARLILSTAIQRYAAEHTYDISTSTVALNGEDIKGRIIGREGRNIRAFEAATGVTVLIDDTPGAVVLSGFDPVRREIARAAMQRLIVDGRIHPARIEEVVAKVNEEMEESIMRFGEEAVIRVGLAPFHPELVKLLGRLRFRHSYAQNILDHSVEVAQLCGLMAAELRANVDLAKRTGLLHDIGKAVSHEVEGAHAAVGAELARRYGEPPEVVNGVAAHHNEVPSEGPYGILVSAADAISASRPGARSETMTTYLKRVEDLERIGMSFTGVEKCFAVQAGRELRVLVQPERLSDEEAFGLARNITKQIQDELHYPGQIRVVVIRETRCVEVAK